MESRSEEGPIDAEDQLVRDFLKDFSSVEYLRMNLNKLGSREIQKIAKGKRKHWYHVSRSRFKTERGTLGRFFEEVLSNLMYLAGWFTSLERAKRYALVIKKYKKRKACEKGANKRRVLTKDDVIAGFKSDFHSLAYMKRNMHLLSSKVLERRFLGQANTWYHASRSMFKKRNGKQGTWYEDVLPGLMYGAEWFDSLEKAREFSYKIKLHNKRIGYYKALESRRRNEKLKDRTVKQLEEKRQIRIKEIAAKFLIDFPSLEYAKNNVDRLTNDALFRAGEGKKRHWFSLARCNFKQENGKSGRLYEEIIPNVAYEAGFYDSVEEARELSKLVKDYVKGRIGENHELAKWNRSKARQTKKEKIPDKRTSRQIREDRKYAIIIEILKRESRGDVSFEGIAEILSLGDLRIEDNLQERMPRAVITSPGSVKSDYSQAELLRMKLFGRKKGIAEAYADALPFIAPYLNARLLALHLISLVKQGKIDQLEHGVSLSSGPGRLFEAFEDLKRELGSVLSVIDVDADYEMLARSRNPKKSVIELPRIPLKRESQDFVECSGAYQLSAKKDEMVEMLNEAYRVLKRGAVFILSVVAKRFGPEFGEGLEALGFDIINPANTRLRLSEDAHERIGSMMGESVRAKALEATYNTYYIIARKSSRKREVVSGDQFLITAPKKELPEEVRTIAEQARRFDRDGVDGRLRRIKCMESILEGFSPSFHARHAVLIQCIIQKFMNEPESTIRKPSSGADAREMAAKLAEKAEYLVSKNMAMERIAKAHLRKISIAERNRRKIKQA